MTAVLLQQITKAVAAGEAAAEDVRLTRERLRRTEKPGTPDREEALEQALGEIDTAMRPIRSLLGKVVWEPVPEEQEDALRAASKQLGYERKQLKKMRRPDVV